MLKVFTYIWVSHLEWETPNQFKKCQRYFLLLKKLKALLANTVPTPAVYIRLFKSCASNGWKMMKARVALEKPFSAMRIVLIIYLHPLRVWCFGVAWCVEVKGRADICTTHICVASFRNHSVLYVHVWANWEILIKYAYVIRIIYPFPVGSYYLFINTPKSNLFWILAFLYYGLCQLSRTCACSTRSSR